MSKYTILQQSYNCCTNAKSSILKLLVLQCLFIAMVSQSFAQAQFTYIGFGVEKQVLADWKKSSKDFDNVRNGYLFNHQKIGDTLILSIKGKETIIRKLVFNAKNNKCSFDQLILPNCNQCTQQQLETILNDEEMKWKEIAENHYLSTFQWRTLLTLSYDEENFCTIMTFEKLEIDKTEYVSLYKSFKGFANYKGISAKNEM